MVLSRLMISTASKESCGLQSEKCGSTTPRLEQSVVRLVPYVPYDDGKL